MKTPWGSDYRPGPPSGYPRDDGNGIYQVKSLYGSFKVKVEGGVIVKQQDAGFLSFTGEPKSNLDNYIWRKGGTIEFLRKEEEHYDFWKG